MVEGRGIVGEGAAARWSGWLVPGLDCGLQGGGLALDDAETTFDGVVGGGLAVEGCDAAVVQLRGMGQCK